VSRGWADGASAGGNRDVSFEPRFEAMRQAADESALSAIGPEGGTNDTKGENECSKKIADGGCVTTLAGLLR
jgi:hypothetical protein